ncbi:ROOT HAIR DEFECTIVE 3-like protein [Drosera capensis]
MDNGGEIRPVQLIWGDGRFNDVGMDEFANKVKMNEWGISYSVISIMGPQSSGKSTLLNQLYGTKFREMNADEGRNQTTQGIWLANGIGVERHTLVMDLEGTDGHERGEDDTAFERRSALFALAVSDVLLVNMWCTDVGRCHAGNIPLLRTVFQVSLSWSSCGQLDLTTLASIVHRLSELVQVMLQLSIPRKTTLIFVLRDQTKSPLEMLDLRLRQDIERVIDCCLFLVLLSLYFANSWLKEPPDCSYGTLFLDHKLNRMPRLATSSMLRSRRLLVLNSLKYNLTNSSIDMARMARNIVCIQVANLRHKISNSIASGAHGGDRGAIDASSFSFSARRMWDQIMANNDLDLPALRVLVATVRCEEIAKHMFISFEENEKWSDLEMAARSGVIPGFRNELTSIIDSCLSQYYEETRYFDEGVRSARRNNLEKELLLHVRPTFESIIGHLWSEAFVKFKDAFDQALNGGQGFSVAADSCTINVMSEFDIGCADVVIQLANWDTSKEKEKLGREIAEYIGSVRDARLSELTDKFKEKLYGALHWPVDACLEKATDDTWRDIRNLLVHETESAVSGLSSELATFNIDETMSDNMLLKLKDYARGVVESKAKEEAGHVLTRMKDRFATSFRYDSNYKPRVWSGTEGIKEAAKAARFGALKLLSIMAAIRLDDQFDVVNRVLSLAFVGDMPAISDPLASYTWEGDTGSSNRSIVPAAAPNLANSHVTSAALNLATEGVKLVGRLPDLVPAISTLATLANHHTSPAAYHTSPAAGAAQEVRWVPPPEQAAAAAQAIRFLQNRGTEGLLPIRRL